MLIFKQFDQKPVQKFCRKLDMLAAEARARTEVRRMLADIKPSKEWQLASQRCRERSNK